MAVDLATLALELNTTGLARGEREVGSILSRLEKRLDATVQRAKAINQAINSALNMNAGAARSQQAFNQQANQFQNHQARLQQIAARNAASLQQIEARRLAAIDAIRERSAQQEINRQRRVAAQQARIAQGGLFGGFVRNASQIREAGESIQQTGYFLTGLSTALIGVGAASVKSAFDIDKNVNVLKSLLGTSEAAEARFKSLVALSQQTPGLTTALASQIDVQLRVANATEKAIDKVLPAIGRLNAVSNIQDPQRFVQNLVQLVTQNFERIDLKELVGQSPLAGEVLKDIFNVESAIDGEKIRAQAQKLGLTTVDAFFTAFGEAAARNSKLANITESLETRFVKLVDRVTLALRPLGLAIIDTIAPAIERGAALIEKLGASFNSLPKPVQSAIVSFGLLAVAIAPVVVGIGAFIQAAGALGNLAAVAKSLSAITVAMQGTAAASTAAGVATATAFAPALPIILAVTAAVGIGALAWASYESAAERGAKVTADSVKAQLSEVDALKEMKLQAASLTSGRTKLNDVLAQLEPSTRAYIASISDEQTQTAELNRVIAEEIKLKQSKLSSDVADTGSAAARAQEELAAQQRRLEGLRQLSEATAKFQQQGISGSTLQLKLQEEATRKIGSTFGTQLGLAKNASQALGQEIVKTTGRIEGLRNAEIQFGATVNALFEANRQLTVEGFIEQQRAIGTSESAIQAAVKAYEAFKQQQYASATSAQSTTSVIDQQTAAIDKLRASLESLNQTAGGVVNQRIRDIALSSRNAAEAKTKFQQSLKLDDDFFFAFQNDQRVKANEAALSELRNPKTGRTRGGGGSSKADSAARELRAAEEQLAKAKAESLFRIEEKSLQSRLELERANYEKRLVDAQGFFENRKRIELDLLKVTEQRIKGEAAASAARLNAAKDGSPEATRELAQLVELQAQLRIVEIERTDKLRELNEELEKNLKLESERNKELLAAGANAQLPLLQRTADNFFARQQSERRDPDAEFRREEIRLQVLANQGLIRESELTDALILKQRELRQLFIEQAEARKRQAEAQANQEGRFFDPREFDLEIERLQLLGSELTRAERLRKRFTDQGILDYSRLNESVEELLAEQKGITEIFADFRANIVRDQFGLIERGVDKLTERLGILGDAIGSLLKDLAKLAVSAIFRRLFGIGGGQPSFAGGGFPAQQGGGGLLGSIVGGFGGGGGGGFAPFATGGFSGGNPAQQILGGGGLGGGIPGGGILSKIPILGKLFGGGASTSAGGASGAVSAAKTAAGIGTQAPGLAASLGAGGLLAGGGLLGSFAGGNSQFGRLLGGVGGTLLGGVVGASGLLGGGVAGALPALFSNPITAIIGGALIGGALLARFFGDREFNKFRKEVTKEYQLKVDNKQAGRELYKSIKAFGEEQFGKGKFGKKIVDTIRLTKAQEQLAAYGEATGQENNPLVKKFRDRKELTDQFDPRNQFIKRAYGGDVRAFRPYIVGDAGRPEVFVPSRDGQIVPSFGDFAREVSRATVQPSQETGGAWTAEFRRVMQTMVATNARMAAALARFESMPPEQVIVTGARRAPDAITGAVNMSLSRATEAGRAMKDEVYKGR